MQKIFFFVLSVIILCACSSKDKAINKQHLKINIVSDPESLDPRKVRDINTVNLSKIFFDGLMRLEKDGNISCAIAENYKVLKDKKTYVFTLKDAFWSNGEKITSYDFEYTWKKILAPEYISSTAFFLFCIRNAKRAKEGKVSLDKVGIKALDEKTLIIELEKPISYFLTLLTHPIFFAVNKKIDQENPKWTQDSKSYISNGPFVLDKWKHYDMLKAKKNEHYWDKDQVKLNFISMFMLTSDTEQNMFELKALDWAGSPYSTLPVDGIQKIKNYSQYYSQPYYGTSFLRINIEKIQDLKLRKALCSTIDRKKIIDHILQGEQIQTLRLIPCEEKIITGFGKKNFKKKKIIFTYVNGGRSHLLAQAIQRNWEKYLNIEVELRALEKKTYYDRIASKDYEIAAGSWTADFNDPINFLEVFKYKNSSTNNTGWEHPEYIDLLNQSDEMIDPKLRKETLIKAENILLADVPIIPICHLSQNYLKNPDLKNVYLYRSGFIDFKYAYFDSNK